MIKNDFMFSGPHASIFNTFLGLNQPVKFFMSLASFLPANVFDNFPFESPSLMLFNRVMWESLINQSQLSM